MTMVFVQRLMLACILSGVMALSAVGKPAPNPLPDRAQAFELEADSVVYSDVTQSSRFAGRVVLTQGSMRIAADVIETVIDPEGYQYAKAHSTGKGLVQLKQRRAGTDEWLTAQAEQLIYDNKSNTIALSKRARIQRIDAKGRVFDQISASELTYNLLTEVFESNPKANTGRTRVTIAPRNNRTP